jgi:hypothetical protein
MSTDIAPTPPDHSPIHATIIPSLDEFTSDLEHKLGRANGNIFHRKPGALGVHDGQIMVRLKKKRYVILDYAIQPTEADFQLATINHHIKIPKGAGKEACKTPDCSKVGVPVCIYDSEPDQPDSLYLRTGLCFNCQRNLNEKRRTERKRPNNKINMMGDCEQRPSLIYAIGPTNKKFRYKSGTVVELHSDAIIVNGAVEGTKHYGEGYGFQEIGADLIQMSCEAASDTGHLVHAVSSSAATAAAVAVAAVEDTVEAAVLGGNDGSDDINTLYTKAFQSLNKSIFLLTQWKASWDDAIAAAHETVADPSLADAVASAAAVAAATDNNPPVESSTHMVSLLLAADKRKGVGVKEEENGAVVEEGEEEVPVSIEADNTSFVNV